MANNFFRLNHRFRGAGSEQGVSLLELAIMLPLLFLLIAGLVDFGIKIGEIKQISQISRQAGRIAASHARRVKAESGQAALCSLPKIPDHPVSKICPDAGHAEQSIFGTDSIADAANKAACNALRGAKFRPEEWRVMTRVVSKNENGNVFDLIYVDVKKEKNTCLICYEQYSKALETRGISQFVLEERCRL